MLSSITGLRKGLDTTATAPQHDDRLSAVPSRALLSLSNTGPQSADDLADGLQVERSVIAALCPRLVTRGLVIRVPSGSPHRPSAIVLSTAGRRYVAYLRARDVDPPAVAASPET